MALPDNFFKGPCKCLGTPTCPRLLRTLYDTVISHIHQCIFIHIPRTGGTSLENLVWPAPAARTVDDLWMGFVDKHHNKHQTGGLQHLTAEQVRAEVGATIFNSYYKFALVRNPWDKAVSQFAYMAKRRDLRDFIGMRKKDSFKKYLALIAGKRHVQWEPQSTFLVDAQGRYLVDYIGRYEDFAASANHILARLKIAERTLPHDNKGARGDYQKYFDTEAVEQVAQLYAEDIDRFGYSYDAHRQDQSSNPGDPKR